MLFYFSYLLKCSSPPFAVCLDWNKTVRTSFHEENHWFWLNGDHAKQPLIKIIIRTWKWHMGFKSGVSWKSPETIKLALSLSIPNKTAMTSRTTWGESKKQQHTLTLQPVLFNLFSGQKGLFGNLSFCLVFVLLFREREREKMSTSFMTYFSMSRAFVLFHLTVTALHHNHPFLQKYQTLTSTLTNSPSVVKVQFKHALTHTHIHIDTHTHTLCPLPVPSPGCLGDSWDGDPISLHTNRAVWLARGRSVGSSSPSSSQDRGRHIFSFFFQAEILPSNPICWLLLVLKPSPECLMRCIPLRGFTQDEKFSMGY